MNWLTSKLGYVAAGMTVIVAMLVPFVLTGLFAKGFTRLGLHVDEMYSGGPTARTIQEKGYTIEIHRAVYPHLLQSEKPFVQIDWKPAVALPDRVTDTVDIDGDGQPDVRVSFDVPKDSRASLHVNVDSLNPRYQAMRSVGRKKFSELIVRVDETILVRVPLTGR
jgi:hypothetical protein